MTPESKLKNALAVGTRLVSTDGHTYTLVRVLGIGGFGITYLGKMHARVGHINVEIPVAVKEFFPSTLCERSGTTSAMCYSNPIAPQVEGARKAFTAEARRLNSLAGKHDNIVAVNEVFEANNTVYYVMEYIDGQSLKQYVEQRGPMTEAAMLGVMRPIVEAVAFLHREHITHLDIKPANIMLAESNDGVRPKLIDFGLSKHYDEQGGATSTLNGPGFSEGFAPREQYRGITTFTPAADVYALAATMLYCLTGQRLPSSLDLTEAAVAAAIPAGVNPVLRSVLLNALALHKDDRTPDAGALLRQLDSLDTREYHDDEIVEIDIDPTPASITIKPVLPKPINYAKITAASKKQKARDPEVGIVMRGTKSRYISASTSKTIPPHPSIIKEGDPEIGVVKPKPKWGKWIWIGLAGLVICMMAFAAYKTKLFRGTELEVDTVAIQKDDDYPISEKDRDISQVAAPAIEYRSYFKNLDLAVKDSYGRIGYFDSEGWDNTDQSQYKKLGVVIDYGDCPAFIWSLDCSEQMDWNEAERLYGKDALPSKTQCRAIGYQCEAVNSAIRSYGGYVPENFNWYWGKEDDSANAWFVGMNSGYVSYDTKNGTNRVRAVAPVPESSAM